MQVHESDELPKMLCENCLYKLELFADFRERSVRTETLLIDLLKEIDVVKLNNQQQIIKLSQTMGVSVIHQGNMAMIEQHHLLGEQTIQNVGEVDLSHLENRDGLIEQEIILSHQSVALNSHSLANIDLNHHELTDHNMANQTLDTEDGIFVQDTNDVHYPQDNLQLIHQEQHLISEQYRLQHGLDTDILKNNMAIDNKTILENPINIAINKNIKVSV